MSYVIYHKETTKIYEACKPGHIYGKRSYETGPAAKGALTRLVNKGTIERDDYAVSEYAYYSRNIEKDVVVKNMMSGEEVTQSVNTPICCDPSSETYWSM